MRGASKCRNLNQSILDGNGPGLAARREGVLRLGPWAPHDLPSKKEPRLLLVHLEPPGLMKRTEWEALYSGDAHLSRLKPGTLTTWDADGVGSDCLEPIRCTIAELIAELKDPAFLYIGQMIVEDWFGDDSTYFVIGDRVIVHDNTQGLLGGKVAMIFRPKT